MITYVYGDSAWIGIGGGCKLQSNTPIQSEEKVIDFPCLVPGSLTYKDKDGTIDHVFTGKGHPWDDGVVTTPRFLLYRRRNDLHLHKVRCC